jgi:hypothetical protein
VDPDWINPDPDPDVDPAFFPNPDPDPQNFWIRIQCGSGSTKENLKTNFFLSSKNQYKSKKILVVCTISYLLAIKMFKKLRKSAFFFFIFLARIPTSHWIRIQSGSTTLSKWISCNGLLKFHQTFSTHSSSPTEYLLTEFRWVQPTDISQYRLRFGFSLLYTDRVPFELLDSAALLWRESCGGGGQILFLNLTTII